MIDIKALGLARPEAAAIQALSAGSASEGQQRLAIAAIRQKICLEAETSFVPDKPDVSAHNEGRRAVGVAIRKVIGTSLDQFPEVKHD